MKPRGIADGAAVVPLFGMGGRRSKADLADAFDALVASLRSAEKALAHRPRQLAEMDRAIARLYEVIFLRQGEGSPSVINQLDQHATRLALLEELVDLLGRRLEHVEEEALPDHPAPLVAVRGGGR